MHPMIEVGKALPAIVEPSWPGTAAAAAMDRDGAWVRAGGRRRSPSCAGSRRVPHHADQVQLRHGLLRRKTDRHADGSGPNGGCHLAPAAPRAGAVAGRRRHGHVRPQGPRSACARWIGGRRPPPRCAPTCCTGASRPSRQAFAAEATAGVAPATRSELARVDPHWLRYAPFTLTGAVTGLALLGVLWRVINEGRVNLRTIAPYRVVAHRLERWPLGWDIALVVLAVVVFIALASTAGYVLAFWHFRLTRHSGGTLHVPAGSSPPGPPASSAAGCVAWRCPSRCCCVRSAAPAAWRSPPGCGSVAAASEVARSCCRRHRGRSRCAWRRR